MKLRSLCAKKLLLFDDTSWENWYRLALVQLRMGVPDEALLAVQGSLQINRKSVEALCLAEQIYMQLGKVRKAKSIHNR